ncbi:hypothetical protein V2590_07450 [Tenacibaculum maritimum]
MIIQFSNDFKIMEKLRNEFIQELQLMNANPVVNENSIYLEFHNDDVDNKLWKKALDTYIGTWKILSIKINHDIPNRIMRYTIPFDLIRGKENDHSFDKIVAVANEISKRI